MNPHQLIKSETVYSGKIFDLARQTVKLPNGKTTRRDVILHQGASAILPILDDGRILFVRQYRDAVGAEILEIPAGRLERGEDPLLCARRELEEETGYRAQSVELMTSFFPVVGYSTEHIFLYLAKGLSPGRPNPDEDEFVTLEPYTLEDALRLIDEKAIIDGKTILAVLLYARAM